MAKDTNLNLRNQVIYQVFPRQHSSKSNFIGVIEDLDRIRNLGVDILYLLPIHPIGQKNKKGSLGCPYSIQNYREINKDLGTLEDFKLLIRETHSRGMKLIIDVVYNHTSRDSYLLDKHPEYFYKNKNGEFANRVGDWWDVTDLDYSNKELWEELISTLEYYVKLGVDGFRCDVASMIPLEFWKEVRRRLKEINPNIILLAETIHLSFLKGIRDMGFEAHTDSEMYEAFDIEYEYDVYPLFQEYIEKGYGLNTWLKAILEQESRYPKNYIKIHGLENHDSKRIATTIKDEDKLYNLNALMFFLKGTTFVYAGQEAMDDKLESLFDIDLISWRKLSTSRLPYLMKVLSLVKKHPLFKEGNFDIKFHQEEIGHIIYQNETQIIECIANMSLIETDIEVLTKDGNYINLIDGSSVEVRNAHLRIKKDPIVIISKK